MHDDTTIDSVYKRMEYDNPFYFFLKLAMEDNASQGDSLLNSRDGCVKGGTHESDARGQLFEPISESNVEPSSLNLWLGIADTRMQ